jgi:hypothetical protein
MFATPLAFITNVPLPPVEVVHAKVALAVPEKLIVDAEPGQIEVEEVSVAVGRAFTVTTLTRAKAVVQGTAPALITLTSENVVFALNGAELIIVVPPAPITTLCGTPPAK